MSLCFLYNLVYRDGRRTPRWCRGYDVWTLVSHVTERNYNTSSQVFDSWWELVKKYTRRPQPDESGGALQISSDWSALMCHKQGHYKYSNDHPLDVTRQGVINSWWPLWRRQWGSVTEIPFVPYLRVSLAYGRHMMYSLKCRTLTHAHERCHTCLKLSRDVLASMLSLITKRQGELAGSWRESNL